MIFATYYFLALCLLFFPVYWCVKNTRFRLGWLLAACLLFQFHYAGAAGVGPILLLGVAVYFLGLSDDRRLLLGGIILCVCTLVFYKYTVFLSVDLIGMFHPATGRLLGEWVRHHLPPTPPLAVSFFAFEFIHYLVDRCKGTLAMRNPLQFGVFSLFFPTLVAGPIKRYEQFLPSVGDGIAKVDSRDVMTGLVQASLGYSKKMVADNLALWIAHSQPGFDHLSLGMRWAVFAAIALRILFDFSGYSDIAIGIARMMGIRVPANFNWPYSSTSIRDFWHRWHISLSLWIRDYVYIPLGGSRHGAFRRFLNGLAAFSLCGLWHGPSWNFVLWGLYHGIGLSACTAYEHVPLGIGQALKATFIRIPLLGWILTLLFVCFGWLLFFYPVHEALRMAELLVPIELPKLRM